MGIIEIYRIETPIFVTGILSQYKNRREPNYSENVKYFITKHTDQISVKNLQDQ